jgi:predicted ester cyclase
MSRKSTQPAPQTSDVLVDTKRRVLDSLRLLAEAKPGQIATRLAAGWHPDAEWRASHPMNEVSGLEAIADQVWRPLITSFPDLERRDTILVGGVYNGVTMVAAIGHYCGTFKRDLFGIPATNQTIYLRYGEVHELRGDKIARSTSLIDVLDLIRQAGFWPVAPSMGTEGMWPGPLTADGLVLTPQDPLQSAASIAQTLAMHKTLGDYNDLENKGRLGLINMPQKLHWHPKMMWYGPSGIGTTRGLAGFVDGHQLPFRIAFPNRRGGNHYIRIGDGLYSVTGGWPSVYAKHLGGSFMGVSPTGRDITMRVMDFYLHHEGLIRENWVPLDILNLLLQMDIDVLARARSFFRRGRHD